MKITLFTWIAGLLAISIPTDAKQTLEFEEPPLLNALFYGVYTEAGFEFSGPKAQGVVNGGGLIFRDSALISPNPDPRFFEPPVNGTKYVASFSGSNPVLRRQDGGLFSLHSLDLAEYSSIVAIQYDVTVTGLFADGGRITNTCTLDGHVDALIDPPDFEKFELGPEWSDLVEVRFLSFHPAYPGLITSGSFDNIAVSVPEPGALSLPAVALIVILIPRATRWFGVNATRGSDRGRTGMAAASQRHSVTGL